MLVILLLSAAVFIVVSIFGDNSYAKLTTLRRSLEAQKALNQDLKDRVEALDSEVRAIQVSDRELEKRARNELGMARSDELIFIFEKESPQLKSAQASETDEMLGKTKNGSRQKAVPSIER